MRTPSRDTKVLVTGAAGFVGRRLVARLADAPRTEVVVAQRSGAAPMAGFASVSLDLLDRDSVMRAVEETCPDVILHLAAQASVGQGFASSATTWSANLCGTVALAEAVATHVPDATVLFASTVEVYGLAFNHGEVSEVTPPQPQSSYAWTKLAGEKALADILPSSARLIVVRPSNHSGRGQDNRFVLPSFATQIRRGGDVLVGNLDAQRDFLHVEDVVDAYVKLVEVAPNLSKRSLFNLASGNTVSVGFLLNRMLELSGSHAKVVVDQARLRPSDVPVTAIDASRIRRELKWSARRGVDEMLNELMN